MMPEGLTNKKGEGVEMFFRQKITLIVAALIFFAEFLSAESLTAKYDVTYGLFGRVGVATASLTKYKDGRYHIKVTAKARGLAAFLSNGREEEYESFGRYIDGVLVPKTYSKMRKTRSKKRTKHYTFDHKNKKISVNVVTEKNGKKEIGHEQLKYYAKDDLLTLFFNIKKYLNDFSVKEDQVFYAVGANKKDGRVDIHIPKVQKQKKFKKILVTINQKIFASKKGELILDLDDKGICQKAVLKDVIFFGDIRGEIKELKVAH